MSKNNRIKNTVRILLRVFGLSCGKKQITIQIGHFNLIKLFLKQKSNPKEIIKYTTC